MDREEGRTQTNVEKSFQKNVRRSPSTTVISLSDQNSET
jgi:hypothetical protein